MSFCVRCLTKEIAYHTTRGFIEMPIIPQLMLDLLQDTKAESQAAPSRIAGVESFFKAHREF